MPKRQVHQQRLSLGVMANPARLKEAEQEARKIGALLACQEFDWKPYLRMDLTPILCHAA